MTERLAIAVVVATWAVVLVEANLLFWSLPADVRRQIEAGLED